MPITMPNIVSPVIEISYIERYDFSVNRFLIYRLIQIIMNNFSLESIIMFSLCRAYMYIETFV